MKHQLLLAVAVLGSFVIVAEAATTDIDFYKILNNPEARLSLKDRITTRDRIAAHGYPAEHHHIVTEDGYIVGVFRIPYSHKLQNQDKIRPIVLVQHGLTSSSDGWILNGPDDALPYLLADAVGMRSAMIDYALATNDQGQKSIHYVGHSQGTTVFFTLMSMRPEYNDKIRTAHMLAPIAIMTNMENPLVRAVGPYLGHRNIYSLLFSSQEFIPYNEFLLSILFNLCDTDGKFRSKCVDIMSTEGRVNVTAMPDMLATHPAGCSTNQMLHYLQEQQSGHFRLYDYGSKRNMDVYDSHESPDYPVHLISSELHLWYSDNDNMAAVEDVLALAEQLPNKVMHHMEDPLWDHGDFSMNWEVRKYINEPVIEIMQRYDKEITL